MADVDDRWFRDVRDPATGQVVLDAKGKPLREPTARHGKGRRYVARPGRAWRPPPHSFVATDVHSRCTVAVNPTTTKGR